METFSFSELYQIIKVLREMVKEYHNAEMSEKVLDIQNYFFDLREQMETIVGENKFLKSEIKRLEEANITEDDLELTYHGYYIRKSEKEQGKEIHYCAACWQNHKKLMPIVRVEKGGRKCCNCHATMW